ncbi:response regulator [Glaciimonas soli]|uniref:Response regulator n=1 Tax=Glaciimonas soli TaxID=2590999 RepID=A0A843YWY8_9BURK|nr:response regulator [Glaciimonas soli]MQR02233.1 response regulator [Glaciimonas soli]
MSRFNIRVMFADDHPVMLLGIRQALKEVQTIAYVGDASNSTELVDKLNCTECDVLVTDYGMPGGDYGDGLAMLSFLRRSYPSLKIVVLTMMDNPAMLNVLLAQHVNGVVSKSDDVSHLIPAIHAAYSNGRYLSPAIEEMIGVRTGDKIAGIVPVMLTRRETEVIRLLGDGLTVNQISERLNRSKKTISGQKISAMKKLGITRDIDIYKYVMETGLALSSTITME